MMDLAGWHQANDRYLSDSLSWLRLRLEQLAAADEALRDDSSSDAHSPLSAQIAAAASSMQAAEAAEPAPAVTILAQRLGLSRFELEILLLCAAMELDTRMPGLCAQAQGDPSRAYPTFALALALFDDPAWDAMSPERPLRYWRLIEINQPGALPFTASALRADERIINYIKGLNYLDDRLAPLLVPIAATVERTRAPASQSTAVGTIVARLQVANRRRWPPPIIQLLGPSKASQELIASLAAAELGVQLYRLPTELLPTDAGELETLARLWQRESLLLPLALFLDGSPAAETAAANGAPSTVRRFLSRSGGLFFLGAREALSHLDRTTITIDAAKPSRGEQQEAWSAVLGAQAEDNPLLLSGQFDLDLARIVEIAAVALGDSSGGVPLSERLWDLCLTGTRPRLDVLAQRLDPRATWDDLVLPEDQMDLLRQIVGQVRQRSRVYDDWGFARKMNRGLGISALFAGESGTGKTMAAEVIANALNLSLYRIDLSAVVSKYIGETEKNLRRLFDAAEDGGAILFFDEADALFGKRSEVKDSHDRYANIEINYLLQRMEAYRGLAVLATNMRSALDTAFLRRLRFIVEFPFPGPEERKRMWRGVFPAETPLNGLDYNRLAQLNLTGGSIHNVALNAAFRAAEQGEPVTMPIVLGTARAEFRKLERNVREADFYWQEQAGVLR